uniref:Checkpoint protein n=1 Tax=Lingulaulax polyedra TaxID=160621 RepID=A0A516AGH4_LINPO|nr:checkpoint protein HUS1 [Lingulodinium polyedra]
MKFKAVIENEGAGGANQVMILHVLQALQRLERAAERKPAERRGMPATLILKLTPESFALCHRGGADEGSQTWSHFQIARLFREYRIESKRSGRIDLEAPIANLVHVFHSCASSDRTTLRLANGRDGRPILGFDFSLTGNVADHRVEQEVPVRVLPEPEADMVCEPALPEPEYQIELPPSLQRLKNVLEKMRTVGCHHVAVEAAMEKQPAPGAAGAALSSAARAWLRFCAEAELVSIESTFQSLSLVTEGKKNASPEGPVRLILSLRRLGEVLAAFQTVSAEAHIACVLEDRALVLYALLPQSLGSLISYTPAVVL